MSVNIITQDYVLLKKVEKLSKTNNLYNLFIEKIMNNMNVHLRVFLQDNLKEDDYKLRETFFHSTLSIELNFGLDVY